MTLKKQPEQVVVKFATDEFETLKEKYSGVSDNDYLFWQTIFDLVGDYLDYLEYTEDDK